MFYRMCYCSYGKGYQIHQSHRSHLSLPQIWHRLQHLMNMPHTDNCLQLLLWDRRSCNWLGSLTYRTSGILGQFPNSTFSSRTVLSRTAEKFSENPSHFHLKVFTCQHNWIFLQVSPSLLRLLSRLSIPVSSFLIHLPNFLISVCMVRLTSVTSYLNPMASFSSSSQSLSSLHDTTLLLCIGSNHSFISYHCAANFSFCKTYIELQIKSTEYICKQSICSP